MGLRFRRSIRIVPGIRLNVSKSGVGIAAGPRGARIGVGPRGVHRSVGLPGTGIFYREDLGWGGGRSRDGAQGGRDGPGSTGTAGPIAVQIALSDDGTVSFLDGDDQPLPPSLVRRIRAEHGDELQAWLEEQCERWNGGIERLLGLHHDTPDPDTPLRFEPEPFDEPRPEPSEPQPMDLLARVWSPRRKRIEEENRRGQQELEIAMDGWRARKGEHDRRQAERRRQFEKGRLRDPTAMEQVLEDRLARLEWPRETEASFEILGSGETVMLDVDLPEVEDMPTQHARVAARGVRILIRDRSATRIRMEYAQHVHAVLFRLVGEVFATLPQAKTVVVSGYTQRPDPATGEVRDDYLLSARLHRDDWGRINFENLPAVDLFTCFERFELRRNMTRTGTFRPVAPFEA